MQNSFLSKESLKVGAKADEKVRVCVCVDVCRCSVGVGGCGVWEGMGCGSRRVWVTAQGTQLFCGNCSSLTGGYG